MLPFEERGGAPGEKSLRAWYRTNILSWSSLKPGSYWWEAGAFTTAPPLLPCNINWPVHTCSLVALDQLYTLIEAIRIKRKGLQQQQQQTIIVFGVRTIETRSCEKQRKQRTKNKVLNDPNPSSSQQNKEKVSQVFKTRSWLTAGFEIK